MTLILRNVRPMGGPLVDIATANGAISAIGPRLAITGEEIDGQGHAVIPGLIDHHIHIMATAAKADSVDLSGLTDRGEVRAALRAANPKHGWIRAIGFDERAGGLLDKAMLDEWRPDAMVRVQDRTGALWMLNSRAMAQLGNGPIDPATGHLWRGDAFLRPLLPLAAPDTAALGQRLAVLGITGLTDAGANNGPDAVAVLGGGGMPQRLMLMGNDALTGGPLKLLYDESDLPEPAEAARRIRQARQQGRSCAAHCVTLGELLFYLAALELAGGAQAGDRIEHGSIIPASLIPDIAAAGLTVVTQPGFVATRGDRYLAQIPSDDLPDLYRLGSLITSGIKVAAGSDAPYGDPDPWAGMRAAISRTTATGAIIGADERITAQQALGLYGGTFENPGGPSDITPGMAADLLLLSTCLDDLLAFPDASHIAATIINGKIVFSR